MLLGLGLKGNHGGVNRIALPVHVIHIIFQPFRVVEGLGAWTLVLLLLGLDFLGRLGSFRILSGQGQFVLLWLCLGALISENDGQTLVQEGHFLQALSHGVKVELSDFEDLSVWPEALLGAGTASLLHLLEFLGNRVVEVLTPQVALALDFSFHAGGQCVHHGNTHAVQTAGNRIGIRIELAAGVQLGHDHLDGRHACGVHLHGDTAAIIDDLNAAIFQQFYFNLGGITRHGLIHGVIHDFPHQVVQAAFTGGTDVHAGSLTNGFQSLKDGDGFRAVIALCGGIGCF